MPTVPVPRGRFAEMEEERGEREREERGREVRGTRRLKVERGRGGRGRNGGTWKGKSTLRRWRSRAGMYFYLETSTLCHLHRRKGGEIREKQHDHAEKNEAGGRKEASTGEEQGPGDDQSDETKHAKSSNNMGGKRAGFLWQAGRRGEDIAANEPTTEK
eukprot:3135522-Rhodomonas_salina.1